MHAQIAGDMWTVCFPVNKYFKSVIIFSSEWAYLLFWPTSEQGGITEVVA